MSDGLKVSDAVLETAALHLAAASRVMIEGNAALPSGPPATLTTVDDDIMRFVSGLSTARLALADAAKTASASVTRVMRDSSELDARLANALHSGFAVRRGAR